MTDRSMDAMEHPEEGMIHAWLDDALDAAEAERLAAHVAACAECQGRVAEARGLIAGASRIVAALDDVPAGTRPGWAQSARADTAPADSPAEVAPEAGDGSLWRWLRVTPGRAALAATILVAIGITLTYDRAAMDSSVRSEVAIMSSPKADAPASTSPEGAATDAAKPRDALLDSAVARNLALSQGRRTVGPAPGPAVPTAPPPRATPEPQLGAAGQAVALGRETERAEREARGLAADRARTSVTGAVASVPAAAPVAAAGVAGPSPRNQAAADQSVATMTKMSSVAVAKSCVRVETSDANARWADQAFPLLLVVSAGPDDAPRDATVLTAAGEPTRLRATWIRRGGDSAIVRLRRIGYSGSIALGPESGGRSGVAISAVAPTALEEVVATAAPVQGRADAARSEARKAASAAPAREPAPAAGPPIRQLNVTARTVVCPAS